MSGENHFGIYVMWKISWVTVIISRKYFSGKFRIIQMPLLFPRKTDELLLILSPHSLHIFWPQFFFPVLLLGTICGWCGNTGFPMHFQIWHSSRWPSACNLRLGHCEQKLASVFRTEAVVQINFDHSSNIMAHILFMLSWKLDLNLKLLNFTFV